jgi:hypothetical protein
VTPFFFYLFSCCLNGGKGRELAYTDNHHHTIINCCRITRIHAYFRYSRHLCVLSLQQFPAFYSALFFILTFASCMSALFSYLYCCFWSFELSQILGTKDSLLQVFF